MVEAAENIKYVTYTSEDQLEIMMKMIESELSEPYSIFTYRYFVKNWPHLSYLVKPI
jgi:N-alpha-acetyltransferase 30